MKVEVYVPVLIKFSNDGVVFKDRIIAEISEKVYANFDKNENKVSVINHLDYFFKESTIKEIIESFAAEGLEFKSGDVNGEFYYYHHRVIIKFIFKVPEDFNKLRILRSVIDDFYPKMIKNCVFDNINKVSDIKAISFYSYMMILIPKNKHQLNKYTDKLGSVTFSIIESTNRLLSYGYTHYVRISIPSLIVYYDKKISNDIKVDLINLIYQNLLYEKKLADKDEEFSNDLTENLCQFNLIDESKLTSFWNNTMEMLGGKISEKQAHNINRHNFYITLIGLFISGIVLGQTIYDYFGTKYLMIYFVAVFIGCALYSSVRYIKNRSELQTK